MQKTSELRTTASLPIYWRETYAADLVREPEGASFVYRQEFLASDEKPPRGVARSLPYAKNPNLNWGVNLHPFFANLLPEGLRLVAVKDRAGTSLDDLFTLLAAAGPDVIGDVYPRTEDAVDRYAIDLGSPEDIDFYESAAALQGGVSDASLPGEQPKLSAAVRTFAARLSSQQLAILKLSPERYPRLVENEAFCLALARECGLTTTEAKIIHDRHHQTGLLVKRFDRGGLRMSGSYERYHFEDACQLLGAYPADKYRLKMEAVVEAVLDSVPAGPRELLRLMEQYAFSYLIGNGDQHGKNIAIAWNPKLRAPELSPIYDVVCTLFYPGLDHRMALPMMGRDDNFRLRYFVEFGQRNGIPERATSVALTKIHNKLAGALERLSELGFDEKRTAFVKKELRRRLELFLT